MGYSLSTYLNAGAGDDEQRIQHAREFEIADTREKVIDTFYSKKISTRKSLENAFILAEACEADSPRTAWGIAQGITRLSQLSPFTDERLVLDVAAGKVLDLST